MEIDPTEGFLPEKDIFGRKSFGDRLTRIVRALENPSVLLLDAPWGTGKTTFVKMWRGELMKAGIPSVYFDAFASDYQEDAFLAVASQIIADAESLAPCRESARNTFRAKAFQTARILGRASLRLGVRVATAGLVEGEALEKAAAEITKDVGDETTKVIDEVLKEQLESHDSDRKVFEKFRTALTELAGALSSPLDGDTGEVNSLPLVFIIDELDRCRPSFSLEILEKIKHFFSVRGVVFLLVSSLSQLKSAVRFAYGDIDAHTYLEKFYHLRILFPTARFDRPDRVVATYLSHIGCNPKVVVVIEQFSHLHPLSLRTLERIAAYNKIVEASTPQNSVSLPQIVSILCILRVVRPELYEAARKSELTFEQIDDLLHFSTWSNQHCAQDIGNWWLFGLGRSNDEAISANFEGFLAQYNINPYGIIPHYCDVIDGFAFPDAS
jgi:KAP family P-loop domain